MSHRSRFLLTVSLSLFILCGLTLTSKRPLVVSASAQMEEVEVTDDLVITHNVRLHPGVYHLQDRNRDGIIKIEEDGITLDGSDVVIISDDGSGNPEGEGIGIVMNKHNDLTLSNFDIEGYRYGVEIENAKNVLIEQASVSGSLYGVRIQSAQNVLIQNSDISGNHKDITSCGLDIGLGEYYGGGILFVNVTDSVVRDNTLTNQSTGLEMIDSSGNQALNNLTSSGPAGNETQQNSCWGIRLQGSTDNLLRGNIADYVDRQRYLRDPVICPCDPCQQCPDTCNPACCPTYLDSGDSAGILLVSGSNHNQIISNSMLYSGDGFFIGNSYERASNNNYVYGNDGSFSPHNAFEATYSDGNIFDRNFASHSDYGFWLGLSYNGHVRRNEIMGNTNNGIAIDRGHDNEINHNFISRNNAPGIRLWADGGTGSSNYDIHHNNITSNNIGLAVENTTGVSTYRNQIRSNNNRNVQTTNVSSPTDISHNNLPCENSITATDNLAYGKSATASVDSGTAARAVDGIVFSENHAWSPGHVEAGQYWQVDLGNVYNISEIVLFPYYGNLHDFPYSYHINVATDKNCSSWNATPLVTELNRAHRQETAYDFPSTPARCLRLVSDDVPPREWIQMSEFAVYADTGHYPVDCRYAFDNTTTTSIAAPRNWWGTTDPAQIMQLILGQVTYTPFLLEPIPASSGADGPHLDGWATTTPLPQAEAAPFLDNGVIRGQQLIFYNNRVYVFGGQKAGNALLQDVSYNFIRPDGTLRPNGWTSATPLPGAFYDHVVLRVGNHVYLITGAAGATAVYYATLQADGSLSAWTSTEPLNPSRQSFAAVAYGNYIYAAGGNSGGMRDFVKFTSVRPDGSLNPWTETTALPAAMQAHTLAAYDDYLYVIAPSGQIHYASINSDGTLGTWTPTTALPQAMSSYATFEHDGSLYVLGGNSTTVYYAPIMNNGTLGSWQTTANLPEQLKGLRVGASDGYVYVIGGYDGTTYRSTVSYARLEVAGGCDGGENLTAQFTGGVNAVASALTYRGLDTVTVSGVGQASGGDYSDAFYIFADGNGNPITPWHPTGQYNWLLSINGAHAEALIRDQHVPAYRLDHRYTFQIIAPAGGLTFGVGDAYTADNTGRYVIGLCGGTP